MEKRKKPDELHVANQMLIRQNAEMEKRVTELLIANGELAFQNKKKEARAAELSQVNKKLIERAHELLQAKDQLAKTLERTGFLASIAENIQDPVISSDNNSIITRWNEAAEKLLEWKSEEVIGKPSVEILKGIYPNISSREYILELLKKNHFWQGEAIYHTKSGHPVSVLVTASQLKDPESNVNGNLVLLRDITGLKKAETQLKEFEYFFNNSNDLSCIANTEGYFEILNPSFEKVLGYSKSELSKNPFLDFVHPDDVAATLQQYEKLKSGAAVIHFSNRYRKRDGSYLWFDWNATPNPVTGKLYCIARDVTDRRKAEEQLKKMNEELASDNQKQQALFASIVNSSDDAMLSKTLSGVITSWNHGAEKTFGYLAGEIIGKHISIIIPPALLNQESEIITKIRRGETVEHYETERIRKDGTVIDVSLTISPIRDLSGNIVGASKISRDITERKKAENEIKTLNEELERRVKERTEELESFSYSVSHDLRAPLRAVNGYARMLEEDYEALFDAEGKRLLREVQNNAKKMGMLIDDLLEFSRLGKQGIKKSVIDMNALTAAVLMEIGQATTYHTEVKTDTLLPVLADYALMGHVMTNLLSNAIKYSSRKEKPVVEITSKKMAGEVVYAVRDNGVGFNMEYGHKLFGVFQRLHSSDEFPGTGVGLAIVQRIIQKHKGKIWAEGKVGKGATFFFSLPDNK